MLTAYYDLNLSPPTFELVSFMLRVEQERRRVGEEQVKVVFLPGHRDGFRHDNAWPHKPEGKKVMLQNVAIPICKLLPACVGVEMADGPHMAPWPIFGVRAREYGHDRFVSAFSEVGGCLRSPDEYPATMQGMVTITLRQAEHWPERNSKVSEWLKAADAFTKMGLSVLIIPDCAMPINERVTTYRGAVMNFFVCNGPAFLSFGCDAPTMMFRPTNDILGGVFSSQHWQVCGVEPGRQMPNCPSHQRIVWEDDTADAIVGAFERYVDMRVYS